MCEAKVTGQRKEKIGRCEQREGGMDCGRGKKRREKDGWVVGGKSRL